MDDYRDPESPDQLRIRENCIKETERKKQKTAWDRIKEDPTFPHDLTPPHIRAALEKKAKYADSQGAAYAGAHYDDDDPILDVTGTVFHEGNYAKQIQTITDDELAARLRKTCGMEHELLCEERNARQSRAVDAVVNFPRVLKGDFPMDDKAERAVTTPSEPDVILGTTAGEPRFLSAEKAAIAKAEPYKKKLEALLQDDMCRLLVRLVQIPPIKLIQRIKVIREVTGIDLHAAKLVGDLFSKRDLGGTRDLFSEHKLYDPDRASSEETKDELQATRVDLEAVEEELKTVKASIAKTIDERRTWKRMVRAGLEGVELPASLRTLLENLP